MCRIGMPYQTIDEVNNDNLEVIYVVPLDHLTTSEHLTGAKPCLDKVSHRLLGRPASLQHHRARGELSTSLPHLPLSRVHLSYSDRTASLKGTFLDAHYLSTSHSSGEYEACHGVCTLRRRCS